jgi:hypothetical protein
VESDEKSTEQNENCRRYNNSTMGYYSVSALHVIFWRDVMNERLTQIDIITRCARPETAVERQSKWLIGLFAQKSALQAVTIMFLLMQLIMAQ